MGDSRAQLLDVVRQVRRRWRIKLALKGAVGFLLAGLVAILAIAYALETLKFTPTAIFWFRIVTGLVLVAAGATDPIVDKKGKVDANRRAVISFAPAKK